MRHPSLPVLFLFPASCGKLKEKWGAPMSPIPVLYEDSHVDLCYITQMYNIGSFCCGFLWYLYGLCLRLLVHGLNFHGYLRFLSLFHADVIAGK